MKISEICNSLELKVYGMPDEDVDVKGAVVGDLLSFVMGNAPAGCLWVTIQNHLNVAAVAVLKEIPLVILASGREPSSELVSRCESENITLASTRLDAYTICGKLYDLGIRNEERI